jgi:RNA polymerase sigma factor (sigma-70 family)
VAAGLGEGVAEVLVAPHTRREMTIIKPDFEALIRDCFQHPGDLEALTRFNTAFHPHVIAALATISRWDQSLVEDAYQAAFIRFIDLFRAGFRPEINYVPYFIAIAKNSLIDELRRARRHIPIDDIFEELINLPQPDERQRAETRIAILQAIMQLKPRCQFVLENYYLAEMSATDLARRLKIKPRSLYTTLNRCREELRRILQT